MGQLECLVALQAVTETMVAETRNPNAAPTVRELAAVLSRPVAGVRGMLQMLEEQGLVVGRVRPVGAGSANVATFHYLTAQGATMVEVLRSTTRGQG